MSDETRHEHAWAIARRAHQLGLSTLADRIEALVDAEVARERAEIVAQVAELRETAVTQGLLSSDPASRDDYDDGYDAAIDKVLALLAREGE